MKIVLFGGTDLTLKVAEKLVSMGYPPSGIVTIEESFSISYAKQGVKNVRYANMKSWAAEHNIPCLLYKTMDDVSAFVQTCNGEFGLVAGWYHMVPRRVRDQFSKGCVGLHASLLPELRGGAPLNWAILHGKNKTGISLFELGDGVDDGNIYGQISFPIGPRTDIAELVQKSQEGTFELLEKYIPAIAAGTAKAKPQEGTPSHVAQRKPEDGHIDWQQSAEEIDRLVRATTAPYPGAFTSYEGKKLMIWASEPVQKPVDGQPGQMVLLPDFETICVVTGKGLLRIDRATDENGRDLSDMLRKSANKTLI